MGDFKVIKCQSCGSSVVELSNTNIAKCSHCGSLLRTISPQNNKILKSLYLVIAMLIVIVAGLFLLNNKQAIEANKEIPHQQTVLELPTYNAPIASIPTINSKAMVITNKEVKAYQDKIDNPSLDITHVVKGELSKQGVFWIITVRNNNPYEVFNPGLIMSLFDQQNKRLDELRVWSKIKSLPAQQETIVLVSLPKPPKVNFSTKITGIAKSSLGFSLPYENIEVNDYFVKKTQGKWLEIIGDVSNPHNFQTDYVEIIAIGKDANGKANAIAWTFTSVTNMPAQSTSGFKIKAGAFVASEVSTWTLLAFGRKHKD